MPVQFERRRTFPVDAATLLAALTSRDYFDARHAMSGITAYRYDAFGPTERGLEIRIAREMEIRSNNVPAFAKRFVGQSATLTTTFLWTRTDRQPYQAQYEFTVGRIPVQVRGTMTLHDDAGGAVQDIRAEITSSVPLVGGKLVELVAGQLDKGLASDYRATLRYLNGERG